MAGIFGFFDFTKPGRGVPDPDNAPKKAAISLFFDIYFRKFWSFLKINLLFNLFNLPGVIAALFATAFIFPSELSTDTLSSLLVLFWLSSMLICIPVVTLGPAQAGMTYLLRNYTREEHAFIWWDFKENALKNIKQSLVVSLIGFVVTILFGLAVNFYMYNIANELLKTFLVSFLIVCFILFVMMQMYIYPLMVTFKYTIRQLYRNALVFAAGRFFPNLCILLLCIALITATFYFNLFIGVVFYLFITVSTIGFIINFYTYPKIKRFILDRIEQETSEDRDVSEV